MGKDFHWKRLERKNLVDSKFLKVYQDTVKLPNEKVIDDYTIVELNNPVIVVAVDNSNRLLVMHEYRYAHNELLVSLPAGAVDKGETPVEAAGRELLEETGYSSDSLEYIGELFEYPTKLNHITHVVLARNIQKTSTPHYEETEYVESIELLTIDVVKDKIRKNEIKTAVIISAIYLALGKLSINE